MTTPTLTFTGTDAAELFTRECRESLDGLCTWNLVREPGELPAGFVHASPPGQGWSFTMWTRDAGVFLRELVLWDRLDEARLVAGCLMDQGTENVLYTMAKHKSSPSWFTCAGSSQRLTGMYGEGWNAAGHKFMPSLGGSIALFFYRGLAGIRSDFSTPGFKKFEIRPLVNVPLTQVRCSFDSPYGVIRSDWNRPAVDSTDLTMDVVIPANTSAIVSVPTADPDNVQEGGKSAKGATGVTFLGHENGRARFEVRSGTYRFQTASCPKPKVDDVRNPE